MTAIIERSTPEKMEIYILGDTHYPRGKRSKFKRVIEEIEKNPNGYMIGLGDWVESITPMDPRYNPEEIADLLKANGNNFDTLIDEQWKQFEEDIEPIAKQNKIIGLHNGNHESTFARKTSFNELKRICGRHNIEYLGDGFAIITLNRGKESITLVTFHGCGAGISTGSNYTKLDSYSRILSDVDVIAAGHTHKLGVNISMDRLKLDGKELKSKTQYQCSCGSFLGNYDTDSVSYAERKAYSPLPIGYVKIILEKGKIVNVIPIPI